MNPCFRGPLVLAVCRGINASAPAGHVGDRGRWPATRPGLAGYCSVKTTHERIPSEAFQRTTLAPVGRVWRRIGPFPACFRQDILPPCAVTCWGGVGPSKRDDDYAHGVVDFQPSNVPLPIAADRWFSPHKRLDRGRTHDCDEDSVNAFAPGPRAPLRTGLCGQAHLRCRRRSSFCGQRCRIRCAQLSAGSRLGWLLRRAGRLNRTASHFAAVHHLETITSRRGRPRFRSASLEVPFFTKRCHMFVSLPLNGEHTWGISR